MHPARTRSAKLLSMNPAFSRRSFFCGAVLIAAFGMTACWSQVQSPSSENRSKSFGPDACGPADPTYIRTANETGGIPMFLQRSEVGKSFQLVRESTRENMSTVLWATGPFDGKAQIFKVPVDSVTQRITFTFSVNTKGGKVQLTQPSGQVITQGSPRTENTDLNCGRIVTVTSPEAGIWHAEVSGAGTFWLEAQAQSDIYLLKAEFVKEGGRPGHEGLFRIHGQPLIGAPATLQATIAADKTLTNDFSLVSQRGDVIQKIHMNRVNSDREFLELVGNLNLPNVPFRVAVTGRDTHGKQYQRFNAALFHAESVEVLSRLDFDELQPGQKKQAVFAVRNLGSPRTFKVTVVDTRNFMISSEPKELSLSQGQSGMIRVDLAVPPGAPLGTGDDIVVVAASTTGPSTSNSSVVHLNVTAAH